MQYVFDRGLCHKHSIKFMCPITDLYLQIIINNKLIIDIILFVCHNPEYAIYL